MSKQDLKVVLDALSEIMSTCEISYSGAYDGRKAIAILQRLIAAPEPEPEPEPEPACPVCQRTPTFTFDRRVGEWSGFCRYCAVEGSPAPTEKEAIQKWIALHHKLAPKPGSDKAKSISIIKAELDKPDEPEQVHQWRSLPNGRWHDASKEEAYSRIDEYYEGRTLYTSPPAPVPKAKAKAKAAPIPDVSKARV
jgi:hypothetical protein